MSKVPQVGRSKSEQHSHFSGQAKLVIASGTAIFLLTGIGVVWILRAGADTSTESLTVSTVRPVETIRYATAPEKTAKSPQAVPQSVPPPHGTVRRMEAISGTFSKK
jgi:hypothetical protein